MFRDTCAALGLLWAIGCAAPAVTPLLPRDLPALAAAEDRRSSEEYKAEVLAGIIPVDKLATRMELQPRMALALATEAFL